MQVFLFFLTQKVGREEPTELLLCSESGALVSNDTDKMSGMKNGQVWAGPYSS